MEFCCVFCKQVTGFVIRAESLVVQRTTTFSKCSCPPDFLVVRMILLGVAPSYTKPNPGMSDILPSTDYFSVRISFSASAYIVIDL